MKRAEKPDRYLCIDLGSSHGYEYKWANPALARHLFKTQKGWKRYYRGTGPYRGSWDLLRRPIPKRPKPQKATRKDIVELHGQLTAWLNTHR